MKLGNIMLIRKTGQVGIVAEVQPEQVSLFVGKGKKLVTVKKGEGHKIMLHPAVQAMMLKQAHDAGVLPSGIIEGFVQAVQQQAEHTTEEPNTVQ